MRLVFFLASIVIGTNCNLDVQKCCNDLCGQNDLIIKEHCDDCYTVNQLALEDEEIQMTCFSCDLDDEYRWNFNKTNVNLDTIKHQDVFENDNLGSQIKFIATNFNETGLITCSLLDTKRFISRNYFICSKLPKTTLICTTLETSANVLSVYCTFTFENFTMKNADLCDYKFASIKLYNWDTGDLLLHYQNNTNCLLENDGIACTIAAFSINETMPKGFSELPTLSLAFNAMSNLQNIDYHFKIPAFHRIYYHLAVPQLHNESYTTMCVFTFNTTISTIFKYFDINMTLFLYEIDVTDDESGIMNHYFYASDIYDANGTQVQKTTFKITDLQPGRSYTIRISYWLQGTEAWSKSFLYKYQTLKSNPVLAVQFSLGSYYKLNKNEYLIFWKAMKKEGSEFKYVIRIGGQLHETENCSFVINKRYITVEMNCKNEIGFGPIWKAFEIYPEFDLLSTKKVTVTNSYLKNNSFIVHWETDPSATTYIVHWCLAETWSLCNGMLEWKKATNKKPFLEIHLPPESNFVFGVSTCYGDSCTRIQEGSKQSVFSMNPAHCWFMSDLKQLPYFANLCKI